MKIIPQTEAFLERSGKADSHFKIGGVFKYQCHNQNGKLLWEDSSHNSLTNQGLQHILDVLYSLASPNGTWYVGIYTAQSGSILTLTGADIGGGSLTEFTNYTGSRKACNAVRTAQTVSNIASKAQFPILGAGTILGSFIASDNSGPASILLSLDAFTSGNRVVTNGDTLSVTYELSASN